MTQDALCARAADISAGSWIPSRHDLRRIESGTRTVTDIELIALAAALEVTIIWLLCGSATEPPIQMLDSDTFRGAHPVEDKGGE